MLTLLETGRGATPYRGVAADRWRRTGWQKRPRCWSLHLEKLYDLLRDLTVLREGRNGI